MNSVEEEQKKRRTRNSIFLSSIEKRKRLIEINNDYNVRNPAFRRFKFFKKQKEKSQEDI
jgi:hypothetical protein